jgi:hypothetical protein
MRQLLSWLTLFAIFAGCGAGWYLQRDDAQAALPDEAAFTYAEFNLGAAADRLEQMGEVLGSFDSIPSDLIVGMTIAYAGGDRYCIQLLREGSWYHRGGPGGSTQRGACV